MRTRRTGAVARVSPPASSTSQLTSTLPPTVVCVHLCVFAWYPEYVRRSEHVRRALPFWPGKTLTHTHAHTPLGLFKFSQGARSTPKAQCSH